jgi:hypothetical protein
LEIFMNRLFFFAAASLALALSACGGSSPSAACNDAASAACDKMYTCYTGAELDAIKGIYGATAAECTTKLQTMQNCAAKTSTSNACETGKTYDSAAASTCISEFKALSCDALKANMTPASCNNVCK